MQFTLVDTNLLVSIVPSHQHRKAHAPKHGTNTLQRAILIQKVHRKTRHPNMSRLALGNHNKRHFLQLLGWSQGAILAQPGTVEQARHGSCFSEGAVVSTVGLYKIANDDMPIFAIFRKGFFLRVRTCNTGSKSKEEQPKQSHLAHQQQPTTLGTNHQRRLKGTQFHVGHDVKKSNNKPPILGCPLPVLQNWQGIITPT